MKYKLGVYALALLNMSVFIVIPTVGPISKDFPDISVALLMSLTTFQTVFSVPGALLTSTICQKIGSKTVAIIGQALILVSGILIPATSSFGLLLLLRAVSGIGMGINTSVGVILIAELFEAEDRPGISGIRSTFANGGGILFSITSGVLAANFGWRTSYLLFGLSALIIILIIICLPANQQRPQAVKAEEQESGATRERLNWGVYWILLLIALCYCCVPMLGANLSLHILNNNIGTTSQVGLVTSINVLTAALAGVVYSKVSAKTKRINYTIGPVLMGLSFITIALAQNLAHIAIGQILNGLGWIYVLTEGALLIYGNTSTKNRAFGVSLMVAVINFAQFVSPYIFTPLSAQLFGSGADTGNRFMVASIGFFIAGALNLFINPTKANKKAVPN